MGVLNTEIGSGFSRGYFLGPQVTLSTIFEIAKRYKSHIALHGLGRLLPKGLDYAQTELEWKHSYYLGKDWDIQASLHIFKAENSNFTDFQELKAGMNFYF